MSSGAVSSTDFVSDEWVTSSTRNEDLVADGREELEQVQTATSQSPMSVESQRSLVSRSDASVCAARSLRRRGGHRAVCVGSTLGRFPSTRDKLQPHCEFSAKFAALFGEGLAAAESRRSVAFVEKHIELCREWLLELSAAKLKKSVRYFELHWEYRIWALVRSLLVGAKEQKRVVADKYSHFFDDSKLVAAECSKVEELATLESAIGWLQRECAAVSFIEKGCVSYSRSRALPCERRHPKLAQSVDCDSFLRHDIANTELSREELKDVDEESELMYTVQRLVRRGHWQQAERVCTQFGQTWRVASFGGRHLVSFPLGFDGKHVTVTGNAQYLLWLHTCRSLAQRSRCKPESWVYSALCGLPEALVDEAQNWEDLLWALLCCRKQKLIRDALMQSASKPPGNWTSSSQQSFMHEFATANKSKKEAIFPCILTPEWNSRLQSLAKIFECVESTFSMGADDAEENGSSIWKRGAMAVRSFAEKLSMTSSTTAPLSSANLRAIAVAKKKKLSLQYYKCVKCLCLAGGSRPMQAKHRQLLGGMLEDAFAFISTNSGEFVSSDYVRFTLHLYLCLAPAVARQCPTHVSQLAQLYMRELAKSKQWTLAAVYCTVLRPISETAVSNAYAGFLKQLTDSENESGEGTVELLKDARDKGIFVKSEVKQIAKAIVESANESRRRKKALADGSGDDVKRDCDEELMADGRVEDAWKCLAMPQPMDASDSERLKALELWLTEESDNLEDSLFRTNELFAALARDYKEMGCSKLSAKITEYGLEQAIDAQLALLPYLRPHLSCLQSWIAFAEATDWVSTWDVHHNRGSDRHSADEWVAIDEENTRQLFGCVLRFLQFPRGWLHPVYCSIGAWKSEEVEELRGVLLFRVLHRVCQVANLTGNHKFCLDVMEILADERFQLYDSITGSNLKSLLCLAKEAHLQIITTKS